MLERASQGQGLTRPELAVLLSYSKIFIKAQLVNSDLHEDAYVSRAVLDAFPAELIARYEKALLDHRLQREIIASQLANAIVDHMGITFVVHLLEFIGGTVADVTRAYVAFADSYRIEEWIATIAEQQGVAEEVKLSMLLELIRLGRRCTRWILRHRHQFLTVEEFVGSYAPRIEALLAQRGAMSASSRVDDWRPEYERLRGQGVSDELAIRSAGAGNLVVGLPMLDVSDQTGVEPPEVAKVFLDISQALSLDWLSEQLGALPATSHWQAMERDSLSDEVVTHQAALAVRALQEAGGDVSVWTDQRQAFVRDWRRIVEEVQHTSTQEFSMFSMTCRKLSNLCRTL